MQNACHHFLLRVPQASLIGSCCIQCSTCNHSKKFYVRLRFSSSLTSNNIGGLYENFLCNLVGYNKCTYLCIIELNIISKYCIYELKIKYFKYFINMDEFFKIFQINKINKDLIKFISFKYLNKLIR